LKYYQLNEDGLATKLTIGLSSEYSPLKFHDIEVKLKQMIIKLGELSFKEHVGSGEFGSK
jgi:hypothetical protein